MSQPTPRQVAREARQVAREARYIETLLTAWRFHRQAEELRAGLPLTPIRRA